MDETCSKGKVRLQLRDGGDWDLGLGRLESPMTGLFKPDPYTPPTNQTKIGGVGVRVGVRVRVGIRVRVGEVVVVVVVVVVAAAVAAAAAAAAVEVEQ